MNVAAYHNDKAKFKTVRCLIESEDVNGEKKIIQTRIQAIAHKEHFGLVYNSYFFNCLLNEVKPPHNFTRVSIVERTLKMSKNPPTVLPRPALNINYFPAKNSSFIQDKMAVCVKPFYNRWNKALWLIEFIEMYKQLGAEHFIMYNHTVGSHVQPILKRYLQVNFFLQKKRWKLCL